MSQQRCTLPARRDVFQDTAESIPSIVTTLDVKTHRRLFLRQRPGHLFLEQPLMLGLGLP